MWRSQIVARYRQRDTDYAGPQAFLPGEREEIQPGFTPQNALIYCIKPAAKSVLYTTHEDIQKVFQHPFLYMAQFETAQSLIEVPLPMLERMDSGVEAKPIYIFSIGRCGSTALSKALARAGVPSVSEPDLPTQIALFRPQMMEVFGRGGIHAMLRAMNRSLAAHLGRRFVVKFRSQCNIIVDDMLDAQPGVETIFMFRGWNAWLRSTHRAFSVTGERMAINLCHGVLAYHRLLLRNANPKLIWYEDMLADANSVLRHLGVTQPPGEDWPDDMEDSQAGTSFARDKIREKDTEELARQAFMATWARIRPKCLDNLPEVSLRLGL